MFIYVDYSYYLDILLILPVGGHWRGGKGPRVVNPGGISQMHIYVFILFYVYYSPYLFIWWYIYYAFVLFICIMWCIKGCIRVVAGSPSQT